MTPAAVSMVDQALSEFGARIDALVKTYNALAELHGPGQASADICALVNVTYTPTTNAAILAVAIARLAKAGGE